MNVSKFNGLAKLSNGVLAKPINIIKEHSSEILIAGGIVSSVASTVFACKATIKAIDILEETKKNVEIVHEVAETKPEKYNDADKKKDLATIYAQTAVKLAKEYAPAFGLCVLSIGCVLKGNIILRKRNIALAAAYTALNDGFKEYRDRVVDRFGETVDRELRYGLKAKKITETVIDEETGKEKKVKRTIEVADSASIYARYFEEYVVDDEGNTIKNANWNNDPMLNLQFLKAQQQYANDILVARKRLTLNEVYRMLGLPETKAGLTVGWRYSEKNPTGDNFVSFALYNDSLNYSDFIYGVDGGILLDFNVDGDISQAYSNEYRRS